MKKRKTVYICDHCGIVALKMYKSYRPHFEICKKLPSNWTVLGREHLCPRCSRAYIKSKKEVEEWLNEKHE